MTHAAIATRRDGVWQYEVATDTFDMGPDLDWLTPPDRDLLVGSRIDGTSFEHRVVIEQPDGTRRWMLCRASVDCGIVRGSLFDIHVLAAREEELERRNRDLEEFTRVVSHDLRSPIRGIKTISDFLREDGEFEVHYPKIDRRLHRLERLIDDLQRYARIGEHHHSDPDVNLKQLADSSIDSMETPLGVTITADADDATVTARPLPLASVIRSLLDNAIKHGIRDEGQGPQVKVHLEIRHKEEMLLISVHDNGPGIDPRYHEQVFAPLRTLQPRDVVEGSGLGLAIAAKTVRANGGTMRLESSPEIGTTFYISWPTADK